MRAGQPAGGGQLSEELDPLPQRRLIQEGQQTPAVISRLLLKGSLIKRMVNLRDIELQFHFLDLTSVSDEACSSSGSVIFLS